jgi:hypothetical protein
VRQPRTPGGELDGAAHDPVHHHVVRVAGSVGGAPLSVLKQHIEQQP